MTNKPQDFPPAFNDTSIPNLKEWYRRNAGDSSVSYKEFLKRIHRLGRRRSHVTRQLIADGLLERPPRPVRKYKPSNSPFLAYDGEGRGKNGLYLLLANSLGDEVYNPEGLSTKECLDFLTRRYDRSYIRIFYGFGYDVNMSLKDMPNEYWDRIEIFVRESGHRVQYLQGKMLKIDGFTYYDILPFFARSLSAALKDVLHVSDPVIDRGKSLRADLFDELTLDEIREYNMHEMQRTVELAEHLRTMLNGLDLPLASWYGPGAIAKKMFAVHGIERQNQLHYPPECYDALENAYYGGRFENQTLGKHNDVWEYDIHSAYPSIIKDLPYFRNWNHTGKYNPDLSFAVWRVSWDLRKSPTANLLQPLPFRDASGRLSFPLVGSGWYWAPEVYAARAHYGAKYFRIHEGWIAETEGTPFSWVEDMYYERMRLKEIGDASEYAIKVGINSLYGKTAQRVGSNTYFNVAWAGYITSSTRAKLLEAYIRNPQACIGFATDALYTTERLVGIRCSDKLGDWEEKHYPDGGIFILPGLYVLSDGKIQKNRIRGLPNTDALSGLLDGLAERPFDIPTTILRRFISNRLAYRAQSKYGEHRCRFVDVKYVLNIREPRKRYYDFPVESLRGNENNPEGVNYGAILTQAIQSRPVIWGSNRLHTRTDGEIYIKPNTLFIPEGYKFFMEYQEIDIPKSVSRTFTETTEDDLSFAEQEGELIAELEPERIWDNVPMVATEIGEYEF